MKRIATPVVGGIFTSFIMELVVYPAIYEVGDGISTRRRKLRTLHRHDGFPGSNDTHEIRIPQGAFVNSHI